MLVSLLALLAAIFGGLGKRATMMTGLLFVLIVLQPVFMAQRHGGIPALSALHTLNAAFIGMTAGMVARVGQAAVAEDEMVGVREVGMEVGA